MRKIFREIFLSGLLILVLSGFFVFNEALAQDPQNQKCLEYTVRESPESEGLKVSPDDISNYPDDEYQKICSLREGDKLVDIEPLGSGDVGDFNFIQYIVRFYNFGIAISGALALIMVVWGGLYVTISGAVDKKKEGYDMIRSALWGLALLFGANLILRTINPRLATLTLPHTDDVVIANDVCVQDGQNDYALGVEKKCLYKEQPKIEGGKCSCVFPKPEEDAGACPREVLEACSPKKVDLQDISASNIVMSRVYCETTLTGTAKCYVNELSDRYSITEAQHNARPGQKYVPGLEDAIGGQVANTDAGALIGLSDSEKGAVVYRYPFYEHKKKDGNEYKVVNDVENARCVVYAYKTYDKNYNLSGSRVFSAKFKDSEWKPCTSFATSTEVELTEEYLCENGAVKIGNGFGKYTCDFKDTQNKALSEDEAQMRFRLNQAGIPITSTGKCTDINNPKCTSLAGMPKCVADRLIDIKKDCPDCGVTVTGGTETGHSAHGPGRPVVDLGDDVDLARYITRKGFKKLGIELVLIPKTVRDDYAYGASNDQELKNFLAMTGNDPAKPAHFHVKFLANNCGYTALSPETTGGGDTGFRNDLE